MRVSKSLLAVSVVFLVLAVFPAPYAVRWLSVLAMGLLLAVSLFGFEVDISRPEFRRKPPSEKKTDVDRTVTLIRKAKKGKLARSLLEERIAGVYATLSDDYNSTFRSLMSEPNEAMRALRSSGDVLDGLEKALKIVEADLNED
ncbi:hypothetical protein [Thermococcus sp.]|uniref:hypothetical protein n=1 Tax=Thermococcus sp. TaxID=35749 RepID=UPI00260BB518|nr:hypothetical protein [Thermococcus sp.]